MALFKEGYTNESGVTEEYWKIASINLNTINKTCEITLVSYHNQQSRKSNLRPMDSMKVRCHWADNNFGKYFTPEALKETDIYEAAYRFCKEEHGFFTKSQDI